MWEGAATTPGQQRLAAIALAVVGSPFLVLGAFGVVRLALLGAASATIIVTLLVCLGIGVLSLTVAYRLFFGRGVRQGGGVLAPRSYTLGGGVFACLAAAFVYLATRERPFDNLVGAGLSLILASMFFVAARIRGAMREIK